MFTLSSYSTVSNMTLNSSVWSPGGHCPPGCQMRFLKKDNVSIAIFLLGILIAFGHAQEQTCTRRGCVVPLG